MDRIEDLAQKASQLTMYDLKSYYNQAKNMVLNVSEMEAKVREATNDDAWGASSTLMKEIAEGTHTFQTFNEIMPTIYSRFMEKEAREWRQIYKALTLLEYLVKNGSERVVDDARSHISTVKMLRSFHYIDQAGKDQGINVRNRAKELSDLLGDVDRIRRERRKAKANRDKYRGVEGGAGGGGMSFQSMTGSRYGGFGSESGVGGGGGGGAGYDGDVYRGGSGSSSYNDQARRGGGFDEYDAGDDEEDQGSSGRRSATASRNGGGSTSNSRGATAGSSRKSTAVVPPVEEKKAPVVDMFSFGDEEETSVPAPAAAADLGSSSLVDDDFDDFQAAPSATSPSPAAVSRPAAVPSNGNNLFDLLDAAPASTAPRMQQPSAAPPAYVAQQPAMSSFQQPAQQQRPAYASYTSNSSMTSPAAAAAATSKPKPSSGGFDDLWTTSLGSIGGAISPSATGSNAGKNKSIQELEREKTMASLWGATSPTAQSNAPRGPALPTMGGAGASKPSATTTFDDLLG